MYLVIYDISDNKVRREVERICKDFGLIRVQKSAFRGNMSLRQRIRMQVELFKIIKDFPNDNIQIYYICREDIRKSVCITNGKIEILKEDKQECVVVI